MNRAICQRLIWKELRNLLPIAVIMGGVAWFLGFLIFALRTWPGERPAWTVYAMYALAAVAAAAIGGVLFASEREWRTVRQLRLLPLPSGLLALSKWTAAAVAGLVFLAVLSVAAWWYAPSEVSAGQIISRLLVIALECFAWSCLLSLVVSRSLWALFGGLLLGVIVGSYWRAYEWPEANGFWFATPGFADELLRLWPRLAVVIGLLAVVGLRSRRWLDIPEHAPWTARLGGTARDGVSWIARHFSMSRRWGRLMWDASQGICPMVIPAGLVVIALGLTHYLLTANLTHVAAVILGTWLGWLALAPALWIGATVFAADHEQRSFEFLGQRGIGSGEFFLSRMIPGFAVTALLFGIGSLFLLWSGVLPAVVAFVGSVQWAWEADAQTWLHVGRSYMAGWLLVLWNGFGIAALASISFSRSVVVGIATLVLLPLVLVWTLAIAWAAVPWWWGSWPIGAMCWVAVWLRARTRLGQRNRWIDHTAPWLVVGGTACALFLGIQYYRAHQIPATTLIGPSLGMATPDDQTEFERLQTTLPKSIGELHTLVSSLLSTPLDPNQPDSSRQDKWEKALRQDLRVFRELDALREPLQRYVRFASQVHPRWLLQQLSVPPQITHALNDNHEVMSFVRWVFHQHVNDGQLEQAWLDVQLIWSLRRYRAIASGQVDFDSARAAIPYAELHTLLAHPEQNVASLTTIRNDLEREFHRPAALIGSTHNQVLRAASRWAIDRDLRDRNLVENLAQGVFQWLPAERIRLDRWLDWVGNEFLRRDIAQQRRWLAGESIDWTLAPDYFKWNDWEETSRRSAQLQIARLTTVPVNVLRQAARIDEDWSTIYWEARALAAHQFALLTKVALLKYRLEHGRYPDHLNELAFGSIHSNVQLDERLRKEISYWPRGLTFIDHWQKTWNRRDGLVCVVPLPEDALSFGVTIYGRTGETYQGLSFTSLSSGRVNSMEVFFLPDVPQTE